jgi:hypothetical protein
VSKAHRHEEQRAERRHVWDDPANVKRLVRWFLASCVVVALVDLLVDRHPPFEHGELPLEGTWFFYAWYGFAACVLLVVTAKQMRRVVMRDEDYYEPKREERGGD